MSKCIDKSDDATLSSSNNTAAVDDVSKGINKVTLEDYDNTPPCDIVSGEEEDMNSEKKCTSYEQKFESTKSHEISHNSASSNANTTTDRSGDIVSGAGVSLCANCGKEGANNTCNKCKSVKYCNAVCKKVHKKKHKKDCEEHLRRAAELREKELKLAAELRDIELFKQPPPLNDCPICFQRLPSLATGRRYKSCCGKVICSGCIHTVFKRDGGVGLCPFCRVPTPRSKEEATTRLMKRVKLNDAEALYSIGLYYHEENGPPQDWAKALELWHQAAELDNAESYYNIGCAYQQGNGVERDEKKAVYYWERAAMKGHTAARNNLGVLEHMEGNMERAIKHYMIAAEGGHNDSLTVIQKLLYSHGHVTKDEFTKALQVYQKYLSEVKSIQRDQAAAANAFYKYIE